MNHALWTAFVVTFLTLASLSASAQTQVIYQHRQFDGRGEGFPANTSDNCCGVNLFTVPLNGDPDNPNTFPVGTYDARTAGQMLVNDVPVPAGNRFLREWEQAELSNASGPGSPTPKVGPFAGPLDFKGTNFYGTLGPVAGASPRTFQAATGRLITARTVSLVDQGGDVVSQFNESMRQNGVGNFGPNIGGPGGVFAPGVVSGVQLGGTVEITPGPNRFGGTMDLLGGIQAQAFAVTPSGGGNFAEINVPFPQGAQPGGIDLNTPLGGVRNTVQFTNFLHAGTAMGPVFFTETATVFLTEFPWTTGMIRIVDAGNTPAMLDEAILTGDHPVNQGNPTINGGPIQLVKPVLVNVNSMFVPERTVATYHQLEYTIVPEPSLMAAMGIGVMSLVGLGGGLRRKQTS